MEISVFIIVCLVLWLLCYFRSTARSNRAIAKELKAISSEQGVASLPLLDPAEYGYRPVGKEKLISLHENVAQLQIKSAGYVKSNGISVSIPIMKGVRFRTGSNTFSRPKELREVACGRLLVTNKAVVFESPEKNARITWSQIADIELMTDGYQIAKRSGSPLIFKARKSNPRFAAILDLMLRRVPA